MKKIILLLALFILTVSIMPNVSFAGDDFRMYNFYMLKYKINDKFDVFFQPDTRFRDDIGDFFYYHFRNGVVFHANKNLDLGTTYRIARSENSAGDWSTEHRLELDITPKFKAGDFKFSNRCRFEHRWLESAEDRWRYRNEFKIAYPTTIGNFEFTPYISEEIYYDFEVDKMNLNWAKLGADKKITEHLLLGIFYMHEASRVGTTSEWDTNHYLGTKAVLSF